MIEVFLQNPQVGVVLAVCLLFALTLHEFGHAYVAYLCGDNTARLQGRMNINPMSHLDPIGTLMIFLVGFGYARPVPVNPRNFRSLHADFMVSGAGPAMNFALVIVGAIVYQLLATSGVSTGSFNWPLGLYIFMLINMNLCLFNLLPIGPLDGSYVLPHFLPREQKFRYHQWNERYGMIALIVLVASAMIVPQMSPLMWIFRFSEAVVGSLL